MTREEVSKLTDDELRIKVAELCGWEDIHEPKDALERYFCKVYNSDLVGYNRGRPKRVVVPNYPADMNAMHEAEQHLFLTGIRRNGKPCDRYGTIDHYCDNLLLTTQKPRFELEATARQRAEAFILTLTKE